MKILICVYYLLPVIILFLISFRVFKHIGKDILFGFIFISILFVSLGLFGRIFIIDKFPELITFQYLFLASLLLGGITSLHATIRLSKVVDVNIDWKKEIILFSLILILLFFLMLYFSKDILESVDILIRTFTMFLLLFPFLLSFKVYKKYLSLKNYPVMLSYLVYFIPIFFENPYLILLAIVLSLLSFIRFYLRAEALELRIKSELPLFSMGPREERVKIIFYLSIVALILTSLMVGSFYFFSSRWYLFKESKIRDFNKVLNTNLKYLIDDMNLSLMRVEEGLINFKEEKDFEKLRDTYNSLKNTGIVSSLIYYDEQGNLKFFYPEIDVKAVEEKIDVGTLRRISIYTSLFVGPYKNEKGSHSLLVYVPIFEEGEFVGTVAASIDFESFIDNFRRKHFSPHHKIIVYGINGRIFWSSPEATAPIASGSENENYFFKESYIKRNGLYLIVRLSFPKAVVFKEIRSLIVPNFYMLYFGAIIIILLFILILEIERRFDITVEKELENRIRETIRYKEKLYSLNKKLGKLITIIPDIDIEWDVREILRNLMILSKSLLDDIGGEILFLESGRILEPTFSSGVKHQLVERLKIKKELISIANKDRILPFTGSMAELFKILGVPDADINEDLKKILGRYKEAFILMGEVGNRIVCICILFSKRKGFIGGDNFKVIKFLATVLNTFLNLKYSFAKTKKEEKRNFVMLKILSSLSFNEDLTSFLKKAFEELKTIWGENLESLGYGFPKEDFVEATVINKEGVSFYKFPVKVGIMGRAIENSRVEIASDVSKDPDYFKVSNTIRSEIIIPIFIENKLYSVIEVGFNKEYIVGEEDRPFFEEIGRIIALSMSNLNLYRNLKESYLETIITLVNTIELKDPYTKEHSQRVASLSLLIAEKMGLSDERKEKLMYASLLHDIGKIAVKGSILNKNGSLTEEEYEEVKKHTILGATLVKGISYLRGVSDIIRHHHERWDGKGYPDGLKNGEICLEARILAVADSFDAMISDRPYRKAFSFEDALNEIKKNIGTQFAPDVAKVFLSIPLEEIKKAVKTQPFLPLFKKYLS